MKLLDKKYKYKEQKTNKQIKSKQIQHFLSNLLNKNDYLPNNNNSNLKKLMQ